MRNVMLFIHILAAMAWVGASIGEEAARTLVAAAPAPARAVVHRVTVGMGTRLYAPAAVLVLISGIWLVVINDAIGFGAAFVSIGFLAVIVGAVFGPAVFGKRGEKAAAELEAGDVDAAARTEAGMRPFLLVHLALLVVAVASMVWKWGV